MRVLAGAGGKEMGEAEEEQGQRVGLGLGPSLGLGFYPGRSPTICLYLVLAQIQKKSVRDDVYLEELFWLKWPSLQVPHPCGRGDDTTSAAQRRCFDC